MISIFRTEVMHRNEFLEASLASFLQKFGNKNFPNAKGAGDWSFHKLDSGKLQLSSRTKEKYRISVSLSHSEKYLAVALSATTNVGLDLQVPRQTQDRLAERIRAEEDCELEPLQLWTVKEAVQKITGLGFQLPMNKISVQKDNRVKLLTSTEWSLDFPEHSNEIFWNRLEVFSGIFSAIASTDLNALAKTEIQTL